MSLILDALKKADSERNASRTQSIFSPEVGQSIAHPGSSRRFQGHVVKVLIFLALVIFVACGIAWRMQAGRTLPVDESAPRTADVAIDTAPAMAKGAQIPIPSAQLPVPAPVPAPTPSPESQSRAVRPAPPAPALMTQGQLPPQVQNELPPLALGGSIYSADPAQRLLLVDKRMLREGDEVAPGLVVDSILQKGAVLRYKGYLFKVTN